MCGNGTWVRTGLTHHLTTPNRRELPDPLWTSQLSKPTWATALYWERGSSVVECRNRNQVSPGSNPALLPCRRLGIFVLSIDACWLSCINEYLAIDSGGHASDLVVACNCCMTRMLPGEAELVSEWTGLPGRAKSVKLFERSNGLDIALYKNYIFILDNKQTSCYSEWVREWMRESVFDVSSYSHLTFQNILPAPTRHSLSGHWFTSWDRSG